MEQKPITVVVDQGNLQPHGPPPIKLKNGTFKVLPCKHCPSLNSEQLAKFEDTVQLLEKISKKSGEWASNLEILRSRFSSDNSLDQSYLEILHLHNSSDCDTLLHFAADKSDFESMQVLLEAGANPNALNRWSQLPLHTVVDEGDGCHCPNCNEKNAKCVRLLLQYGSQTDVQDWEGDTPLACSALTLMDDCARALWDHGASINGAYRKPGGKAAGELLAMYIPDEICRWMDKGVQQHDTERLHLQLDFGVVIGSVEADMPKYGKETHFLMYMTKVHLKAKEMLLLHPLVQAYLHIKWEVVSNLFTLLRSLYLLSALLYTCFIISFFLYNCPYEDAIDDEEGGDATISTISAANKRVKPVSEGPLKVDDGGGDSDGTCNPTPWIYTMAGFLVCFVVCMILNELYEMAQGMKKYLRNGLNYGWLLMIVTVTLNTLPVFVDMHGHWQYVVAAFGVFLAWGMFLTQLARHPKIGIYVEMLGRIVTEFMIFSATYFTLIIGFAFGFAVLFPNNQMFDHVYGFLPFVKVLLIMIGETDYETLFDEAENPRINDLEYSIGAHIIFVGFIIVVTILLSNLLLGLAISDVQELRIKAGLSRSERLIQQIDLLETLFQKSWLPVSLKRWYKERFSIERQCAVINEDSEENEFYEDQVDAEEEKNGNVDVLGNGKSGHDQPDHFRRSNAVNKRIQGPMYTGFQPLRSDEKTLPDELKEKFISFVDKDGCSKENGGGETEAESLLCKNCEKIMLKIMSANAKD